MGCFVIDNFVELLLLIKKVHCLNILMFVVSLHCYMFNAHHI